MTGVKQTKRERLIKNMIRFQQKLIVEPTLSYNKIDDKTKVIRKLQSRIKPSVDFRELLKKYMKHVMNVEGTSFIEQSPPSQHDQQLSGEEQKLLLLIESEIKEKFQLKIK